MSYFESLQINLFKVTMEDLDKFLSERLKPYEEKVSNLIESVQSKDSELLTLKYAIKGLRVTLKEIERQIKTIHLYQTSSKPQAKAPVLKKQKETASPVLKKSHSTIPRIGLISNNKSQKDSISPAKQGEKYTKSIEKRNSVSSTSSSPLRRSSSLAESPLRKRLSVHDESSSPLKAIVLTEVQEEVDFKLLSKKFLSTSTITQRLRVKGSRRAILVDFSHLYHLYHRRRSTFYKLIKRLKSIATLQVNKDASNLKMDLIADNHFRRIVKKVLIAITIEKKFLISNLQWLKFTKTNTLCIKYMPYQLLTRSSWLKKLVFYGIEDETLLSNSKLIFSKLQNLTHLEVCLPYQEYFWTHIFDLLNYSKVKSSFDLGLNFYIKEHKGFPDIKQINSAYWGKVTRLRMNLNHYVNEIPMLEPSLLGRLHTLDLILETGSNLEILNQIEYFENLTSLRLEITLPLRGYQNFFKQISFPNKLSELSIEFKNMPIREIFQNNKDFNPYLEKKFENHEYYGIFAKKVQRLVELKILKVKLISSRLFESWNTYIVTSLIGNRSRLRSIFIEAPTSDVGAEPFDLEELFLRVSGPRSNLRELAVQSYLVEYSVGKMIKQLPKLENLTLQVTADELLCQFRIYNLLDHVVFEKIQRLIIPVEQYPADALNLIEKISNCRNIKELSLNINGMNMTDEEYLRIIEKIGVLRKLEKLSLIISNSQVEESLVEEAKGIFERNLLLLETLIFQSKIGIRLEHPRKFALVY